LSRKPCPRCAERVRIEAKVCRFCGHEFQSGADVVQKGSPARSWALIAGVAIVLLTSGGLSYVIYQDINAARGSDAVTINPMENNSVETTAPSYERIHPGTSIDWSADEAPDLVQRQVGPYILSISKNRHGDFIAPVLELSVGSQKVRMEGQAASPGYAHRITAVQNIRGAAPIVMLESFTGGAHCCNVVSLGGFSRGSLKVVELGTWDGDRIDAPKDISGDGIADFVVRDDSFLYAFAPYASSYSPPKVLNVVNGQVVDVSRRRAFAKLFAELATEAGEVCRHGESAEQRNGACPAYVAAAARIGKLQQAWSAMLMSYDAKVNWDFPTACRVEKDTCPPGLEIRFKSYPESLLFFLKDKGYIAKNWLPPEAYDFSVPTDQEENATVDRTAWTTPQRRGFLSVMQVNRVSSILRHYPAQIAYST
jgi:hypothetical protein